MKSLVLLSGGMDSVVLATLKMLKYGAENVSAVSFNYQQRHRKELKSAAAVVQELGLKEHTILTIPPTILDGSDSVLIDTGATMPQMTYQQIAETPGVSPTYVPFRNAMFLSMATALALKNGIDEVAIATHAEDARNWAYPDCTPEFNGAMTNAIYVGSYFKVRLSTPFQWIMKSEIVKIGLEIRSPFDLSWSCYEGREYACGKCPTCVERLAAFDANRAEDPLEYEDRSFWRSSRHQTF